MNAEPPKRIDVARLRQASLAMRGAMAALRERFEEIEDAIWDKAMRPTKVPLPQVRRQLRWDGEFLLVSMLDKKDRENGKWERLTVDVDEAEVMVEAIDCMRNLLIAGGVLT